MQTPTSTDAGWPTEWMRGALAVCVLHVIADGPTYGYAIASALADAGLGTVKGGLVSVEWRAGEGGPGRKFYALTPTGEEEHRRQVTHWLAFADVTSSFVHDSALAEPSRKEPS